MNLKKLGQLNTVLLCLVPSAAAQSNELLTNSWSLQYSNLFVVHREEKVWIPFKG